MQNEFCGNFAEINQTSSSRDLDGYRFSTLEWKCWEINKPLSHANQHISDTQGRITYAENAESQCII